MKRIINPVTGQNGKGKSGLKVLILIIILVFLISARVPGQEVLKKNYTATYIKNPPSIDGVLNEDAWEDGIWIGDFTQYQPFNNKPVSERTEFKILFDDNNLYVAFRLFDRNSDSIVTRLTRRDQPDGDLVAICLDSYHDQRTGFLFGVSSAGVKYDEVFTNDGQNQDSSWDPNWWVKTSLEEGCWVAEMKIPFSQIRFKKNSGDVWGLQVARVIYRKNETDFWQHIPKDAPGLIHMFGELKGLENIRPHKTFDVTPYVSMQAETYMPDKTNPFRSSGKSYKYSYGLDSKIGVTNNLTLDLTINPDFGQIEADPSVVNLTAFETFYKEKRPFFIEGNNITSYNLGIGDDREGNDNLFYSRRIGRSPHGYPTNLKNSWTYNLPSFSNIIGAAKLTGKTQDGWSVGFVDAVTGEEKAEIDTVGGRIFQPVEPLTNYFVGRVQKDINSGNTIIGGIFTSTNREMDHALASCLHKAAYTGGIDFTQYFKKKSWMFNLHSAFSLVKGTSEAIFLTQQSSARYFQRTDNDYVKFDSDRKSMNGLGGRMEIMKLNGHWNFIAAFLWKSPGFETNDLGYMRQADQLFGIIWASYNQWEPKGIYKNYSVSSDIYNLFDFGGENLTKCIESNANMTFKNYWNTYISGNLSLNQLSTTLLRGGPAIKIPGSYNLQCGFATDPRKKIIFSLNAGTNGLYLKNSGSVFSNISVQFKPNNYLTISLSPQVSTLNDQLQYITKQTYRNDNRYILATLNQKTVGASLRININISPDLSFQYWGQPFIASGNYCDFKYVTKPKAGKYGERFHIYSGSQITRDGNSYSLDENEDGKFDYNIIAFDFNYRAFLSNLVIRWEFNPGSSLYLVWNQTRNGLDHSGMMDYFNNLGSLFSVKPNNVFLVKFSYRFGLQKKKINGNRKII